jgi:hypothetical protein
MYVLIVVAQFVTTDVAHPLQRGSLASSQAKIAELDLYLLMTALM